MYAESEDKRESVFKTYHEIIRNEFYLKPFAENKIIDIMCFALPFKSSWVLYLELSLTELIWAHKSSSVASGVFMF